MAKDEKRIKLPELTLTLDEVDHLGDLLQYGRARKQLEPGLDALQQWTTRTTLRFPGPERDKLLAKHAAPARDPATELMLARAQEDDLDAIEGFPRDTSKAWCEP